MEVEIFSGYEDRILFTFDQDMSTNLWPRHSQVSKAKPLFLKELEKVWRRFPEFNETNTILVDNHIEKFERNPLHTCLLIPEFKHEKNQNSQQDLTLSENGSLVKTLKAIADSFPGVPVNSFIKERSLEGLQFFPEKYHQPSIEGM